MCSPGRAPTKMTVSVDASWDEVLNPNLGIWFDPDLERNTQQCAPFLCIRYQTSPSKCESTHIGFAFLWSQVGLLMVSYSVPLRVVSTEHTHV